VIRPTATERTLCVSMTSRREFARRGSSKTKATEDDVATVIVMPWTIRRSVLLASRRMLSLVLACATIKVTATASDAITHTTTAKTITRAQWSTTLGKTTKTTTTTTTWTKHLADGGGLGGDTERQSQQHQ
jgi:hypothetical protein